MTILDLLGEPEWSIVLPMPPSTNQLFMPMATKGRSRFVTSPLYRDWKNSVAFLSWRESAFLSRKFIAVEVCPGPDFNDSSDSDNFLKAPIDALVNNGVLINDSKKYVVASMAYWGQSHPVGKGVVVVKAFPESIFNGKESEKFLFDENEVQ